MKVLFFISISILLINTITSDQQTMDGDCNLGPLSVLPNFTDLNIEVEIKRNVIKLIWTRIHFHHETPLLARTKEFVLEMAESDSLPLINIAAIFTNWAFSMLRNSEQLYSSFCVFGKTINATLEWKATNNIQKYLEALEYAKQATVYALDTNTYASLSDIGCSNVTLPKDLSRNCWDNGFSVSFSKVWDNFGSLLPCKLHNLIIELSNSSVFSDRVAGIIFNFILMPPVSNLHEAYGYISSSAELGRYFNLGSNSSMSKCCCKYFSEGFHNVTKYIIDVTNNVIQQKTENTDCP